ncbi:ABC transporter permease [Rhodoferax aquaticus]|uniref:ABC transporter permease n=1 Tax=Rhodoferax aquaticus TaxID=2527691 RepID=UPI003CC96F6A
MRLSFLAIVCIVMGVSAVSAMVTLGNVATHSIQLQIPRMGPKLLLLMPGQCGPGGSGGGGGVPHFAQADGEAIAT